MANHYHKGGFSETGKADPSAMLAEIERFLTGCTRPVALEWGDEALPLIPDQHAWEIRNGSLFLSAWPETRSINRKVVGIEARKPGLIVCSIQKFGGAVSRLNLLDLGHPKASGALVQGVRRSFSSSFRRILSRQFPDWTVQTLSTEMSLEQSFSPKYPRALLQRGTARMAAIACPVAPDEQSFLSFGLLWHHYVSGQNAENHGKVPLALFLPDSAGNLTALRLKWLNVPARLFRFNAHGSAGEIDPADLGNLETRVMPKAAASISQELESFVDQLRSSYGVDAVENANGTLGLRLNGLEFAYASQNSLFSVIDRRPQLATPAVIAQIAALLSEIRTPLSTRKEHPLFQAEPENWLESAVTRHIEVVDPALAGQPVLRQVISFAAADRDIIDLIGASSDGRLSVIELKATEDIHLPMQALDYWMRVFWHTRNQELGRFFPELQIRLEPPKLILVAPALQFHSANETILGYFDARIETERIGLNLEWQQGLKVAFRLRGSEKPQSHRRST